MIDWDIQLFNSIPSTQDIAMKAAEEGAAQGTLVQALAQEGGRGRHGNKWSSPVGNLYMSFVLRPTCGLARAGELAFVIAVALSKAMDDYIDENAHTKTLKWPNDILVDGRKISGILLETSLKGNQLDAVIVGTGINIFAPATLAVGLNDVAEMPVYVNKVRDNILDKVSYYYKFWENKGFAPIREAWLNQAHGVGEPITARLPNATHKGVFKGLDKAGSLILETPEGDKIIHAAEVHF